MSNFLLFLSSTKKEQKEKEGGNESATGLLNISYSFHETQQGRILYKLIQLHNDCNVTFSFVLLGNLSVLALWQIIK